MAVGVLVAGGAEEHSAAILLGKGLDEPGLGRGEFAGQIKDDQAEVVEAGRSTEAHGLGGCHCQVFRVVPSARRVAAEVVVEANDFGSDADLHPKLRENVVGGVSELAEGGPEAGLRGGVPPHRSQGACGVGESGPHRDALQRCGERTASR